MAQNLKSRLQLIRKTGAGNPVQRTGEVNNEPSALNNFSNPFDKPENKHRGLFGSDWRVAGHQVLRRNVTINLPLTVPDIFPESLQVIIPDLVRYEKIPSSCSLVFFDLETTGLSGGAGTLAFIGSFGRFVHGALSVDQYLLLDYPGEADFIELLKSELTKPCIDNSPPLAVSYNGKTFDSQILKTRCLMNAVQPPFYFHADLLHPSRRLWRQILPDCSQGTIETEILGLDRTGDVPGAMAPDIWFSFLKTGLTGELTGICDHNIRDIAGLSSIYLLLAKIADTPLDTLKKYKFDLEALALIWRKNSRSSQKAFISSCKTADDLLCEAVKHKMPKAVFYFGIDLLRTNPGRGKELLLDLCSASFNAPTDLKASALHALAKHAEWTERDYIRAFEYTESALSLGDTSGSMKNGLEKRRERLLKKIPYVRQI